MVTIAANSIKPVSGNRESIIKDSIARALKANTTKYYFKSKELKSIERDLKVHLDFILPSMSDYAQEIKTAEKIATPTPQISQDARNTENNQQEDIRIDTTNVIELAEVDMKPVNETGRATDMTSITELSESARIATFQQLTNAQAELMIADIQQAMVLNRKADMHHILDFMAQKNISLTDISEQLDMKNVEAVNFL